jgi:mannobiose 2-epimerase
MKTNQTTMKQFIMNFCFALLIIPASCNRASQPIHPFTNDEVQIASEMEDVLVNKMLHIWYPKIIDTINGGFLTNFDANWKAVPPMQEKMIVTQARDLWTACKAAARYPADTRYRKAADHGFKYLRNVMWDKQYGGFFTYRGVDENKNPSLKLKKAYGNAFAIYALAAYNKLSGSVEALDLAKKDFLWLDKHSHDPVYGGYYDALTAEGLSIINPDFDHKKYRDFPIEDRYKDYNSSIHLLEAFAELYQVWPDTLVKKRLAEMLAVVRDTITTNKGYMALYFERNWKRISFKDSTEAIRNKNFNNDHVSFGHDIETAYLIMEASKALGLEKDSITLKVAKKMVDHSLAKGFDKDYMGIFDGGYYITPDSIIIVMNAKAWWSQAEALNALLMFSKLYPENVQYKIAAFKMWQYIKNYLIDYDNGDWYREGLDNSPQSKKDLKASAWKCNYHTSRSLMNCLELLNCKKIE